MFIARQSQHMIYFPAKKEFCCAARTRQARHLLSFTTENKLANVFNAVRVVKLIMPSLKCNQQCVEKKMARLKMMSLHHPFVIIHGPIYIQPFL